MEDEIKKRVPTLAEYLSGFNTPNYFDDPRTPEEMKQRWYRAIEDGYYKLYGQEKIETLRFRKEGE